MSSSFSSTLLFVALMCMFALTQAAPGINSLTYNNPTCSGQATVQNTTVAAGVCTVSDPDQPWLGYYAQYCNMDGTTYYTYFFMDSACTVANSYRADQVDGSCRTRGSASMKTQCIGGATAADMPLSFPPASWMTTTQCVNMTANAAAKQCNNAGNSADIQCTNSATRVGFCQKAYVDGTNITIGSRVAYCSGLGSLMGRLSYTSDSCTGDFVRVELQPTSCNAGSVTSCPSGVSTLPSSLPTTGMIVYDNPTCTINPYKAARVLLFTDACFGSKTLKCSTNVNGTQIGTYTNFIDSTNKGLCTVAQTPATIQKAEQCVPQGDQGIIFTCSYNPGQLNSASSVSFSSVMMIAVAVFALIAGRSL